MVKNIVVSKMVGMDRWAEVSFAGYGTSVEVIKELDFGKINSGDIVVGNLSFDEVFRINMAGATYKHLTFDVTPLPDDQMTALEINNHRPNLQEYAVSTAEHAMINSSVGQWDDVNGEYGPDTCFDIQSKINHEGVGIKMGSGTNCSTKNPSRKIYLERLEDMWRINISTNSRDLNDFHATIDIGDDNAISVRNNLPAIAHR